MNVSKKEMDAIVRRVGDKTTAKKPTETKHTHELERKLKAIIEWLEQNQPDVFKRGLWNAANGTKP